MKQKLITAEGNGSFYRFHKEVNSELCDGWRVVAGTMNIALSSASYACLSSAQAPTQVTLAERYAVVVEKE